MSDKTCGTCRWFAPVPGDVSDGACLKYNDYGMYIDRGSSYDACDDGYEPRTDSVEQVARDMYRRMTCMAHYECHNNDCECCIDADCKVKEVFGDRLESLGVDV